MADNKKWNDFLSTGKVDDYLAYRNVIRDEGQDTLKASSGDGEDKEIKDAELSNGNGNGN